MFIVFGLFGVPYLIVVVVFYATLLVLWPRFRFAALDLIGMIIPIAVYLFLNDGVEDRQAFNAGYANLVIAAAVCIMLPTKVFVFSRRPELGCAAIVVIGVVVAGIAWQTVSHSAPWPMF